MLVALPTSSNQDSKLDKEAVLSADQCVESRTLLRGNGVTEREGRGSLTANTERKLAKTATMLSATLTFADFKGPITIK